MDLESLKSFLLEMDGVTQGIPFGPEALVYKVLGKMFALIAWDATPMRISLKCDPERAMELRAVFEGVRGAYHFNKRHWNMVDLDGSVPIPEVLAMIEDSYDLVVRGLPKAKRDQLRGEPSAKT
ncbi:MAG: MmcQ/YjbR family DNA-binding protein [Acidimicrobiia bacterium]|nr:MmcQ/YjbR family DNA-binding protein [Acidimicrobiia bacterium]